MSIITDVLDALKNEKRPELILPDALTFPSIDADALARELDLVAEAKRAASHERPDSTAVDLDAFEKSVVEKVMRLVRPTQQSFSDAMNAYRSRLASLDPLGFDARLRGEAAQHRAKLQMEANQVKGEMFLLAENIRQREAEYLAFKQRYNNPPDPDVRFSSWAKYLFLVVLVVIEAGLNSLFLGPYMPGGQGEGFAWAVAFPFLSIVFFGWTGGTLLRKSEYAPLVPKLAYLSGVLISIFAALSVNVALAALRAAAEQSEDYIDITLSLWWSYATLQDFPNIGGVILLAVAMAFFIGALIDMKSLDHPIPGFLAAFTLRQQAHREYKGKMEQLNERLTQASQAAHDLTGAFSSLQSWQIEHKNILVNQDTLCQKYNGYVVHVEEAVNSLLRRYREENTRTRTTAEPVYFASRWVFPELVQGPVDSQTAVGDFQQKLNVVYKRIEQICQELNDEIRKTGTIIPTIDATVLNPQASA